MKLTSLIRKVHPKSLICSVVLGILLNVAITIFAALRLQSIGLQDRVLESFMVENPSGLQVGIQSWDEWFPLVTVYHETCRADADWYTLTVISHADYLRQAKFEYDRKIFSHESKIVREEAIVKAIGWPFRAFTDCPQHYVFGDELPESEGTRINKTYPPKNGIRTSGNTVESHEYVFPLTIPFKPIWLGLTLNTLFFGAIFYALLMLCLASKKWNRRRQNKCAFCGYMLRGLPDPRCPECGAEE